MGEHREDGIGCLADASESLLLMGSSLQPVVQCFDPEPILLAQPSDFECLGAQGAPDTADNASALHGTVLQEAKPVSGTAKYCSLGLLQARSEVSCKTPHDNLAVHCLQDGRLGEIGNESAVLDGKLDFPSENYSHGHQQRKRPSVTNPMMSSAALVMLSEHETDTTGDTKAVFTLTGLSAPKRESLADKVSSRSKSANWPPVQRLLASMAAVLSYAESIKEPERKGRLAAVIGSVNFKCLVVSCIGCNALFIMYTTDYEMRNLGSKPTDLILNVELGFVIFYLVELLLQLAVHRLYFFGNAEMAWNIFDTFLVLFSIVELMLAYVGGQSVGGLNLSFMRAMRLFKVAKVLRVFRTFRFFTELRLIASWDPSSASFGACCCFFSFCTSLPSYWYRA